MSENTNDLNEVFEETMFDAEVITVPIDDTLTHSGEAADAAAVGAALDLKMDKSGMVTISVNGQTPDNQGVILVTAEDTKMADTDPTTIAEAVAANAARTGADIPISADPGAASIQDAMADVSGRTAEEIPMDASEGALMISGKIAEMDQTAVDMQIAITAAAERTGAMIPMSGTDPTKIADAIEARVKTVNGSTPDQDGDVFIDSVPFADNLRTNQAQNVTGTFNLRTTGGDSSVEDSEAWLTTVRGNRIHTGYVPEDLDMTVNMVDREQGEDIITATIDRDTFVEEVEESGTTTLTYSSGSWSESPTTYGITVTGTPKGGDEIVVDYTKEVRGTITQSTPESFKATGWNLYNHTLGYARGIRYSDEYGFKIEGTYTAVQFSTTLEGDKTEIIPTDGYFTIPNSGYIWISGGTSTDTEVYMTWSDWTDSEAHPAFEAYTEHVIDLTDVMETYFPNGLLRVGDVRDEINLNAGLAISNVERLAYSTENLEEAEASGRVYEYDENYIYLERAVAVASSITLDGGYTANDHGIEFFTGSTVPAYAAVLYGNNLKNKLERDVLTISQQELTRDQKDQVLKNIGLMETLSVSDLNNIGLYGRVSGQGSTVANMPTNSSGDYYIVLCFEFLQIAVRYRSNSNASYALYTRRYMNLAWRAWQEVGRAKGNSDTVNITLASGWSASAAEVHVTNNTGFVYVRGLKKSSAGSGWIVAGTIQGGIVSDGAMLGMLVVDSSLSSGSGPVCEARVNGSGELEIYSPQANAQYWGSFAFPLG